jgi:magnesium-transporting ATPase (P-type)
MPAPALIWHTEAADRVATEWATDTAGGLTMAEVQRRHEQFGYNEVPEPPRRSALARAWGQVNNPLIIVLMVAGVVTLLLGDTINAAVIFGVVVINGIIGYLQEGKAEEAIAAVRAMLASRATVVRDGERHTIDARDLVPGDVVLLESGDRVPADLRLIRTHNLRAEESALTGESLPVDKTVAPVAAAASVGDRHCMAYSGTLIVLGQGRGVVVATGLQTELGQIGALVGAAPDISTPLTKRLEQFAKQITWVILVAGAALFAFVTAARDMDPVDAFLAIVGFAVAAIPEGMPAVITIVLAIGTRAMAANRAIVRRLPAVETLGSVSVICSDKTGTLTRNEMTAVRLLLPDGDVSVTGAGYEPAGGFHSSGGRALVVEERPEITGLALAGLLCNDAHLKHKKKGWTCVGDPTEGALITLALKAGLDRREVLESLPRTDVVPFESEQQYMATLHHDHHGHAFVVIKGAPERVLGFCRGADEAHWRQRVATAAEQGERVLAVARAEVPPTQERLTVESLPRDCELLGMVGLQDPPRPEAIDAVAQCRSAGITVKMITGDHAATAAAIGAELGLRADRPLTGAQIEAMDAAELRVTADDADVIARASPEHKMRLIAALQADGNYVAMTGDGANDAPALKAADIGVAMGMRGTDAARDAADLVLTDDNFATIERAVERGRVVYDNIKKSLVFMIPTNGGQAAVIAFTLLVGITMPITVAQILWINMVSAVTLALALAFEPAEPGIMQRPPQPAKQPLMTRPLVWRVFYVSALMAAITLAAFQFELSRGSPEDVARTAAVNALVCGEIFYLFNARRFTASALTKDTLTGNRVMWIVIGVLVVLQLALTYLPFLQGIFETAPLGAVTWAVILLLGVLKFFAVEVEKWFWRRAGVTRM